MLIMMIFLYVMTFIAGMMFGYMCFHKHPKDFTYITKINNSRYVLKFKTLKTETWNDYDGCGEHSITNVELEEIKR